LTGEDARLSSIQALALRNVRATHPARGLSAIPHPDADNAPGNQVIASGQKLCFETLVF